MIFDTAYYIKGIEAGMIAGLKAAIGKGVGDEYALDGYVRMIKPYRGELNAGSLRQAISGSVKNFPLIFVTYVNTGREDEVNTGSVLPGEPITMRRECRFAAVCCSNDARGTDERQEGTIQMAADAVSALGNRLIEKQEGQELVRLTRKPLKPAGDSAITQLPNIWAIAQYFDTSFDYDLADQRNVASIVVTDINLTFDVLGSNPSGAPGVIIN